MNMDNHLTSDTVCLGRPIFAQRVWDVMQALRYLQQRSDIDANRVRFYGKGANGLHGIFAGALALRFNRSKPTPHSPPSGSSWKTTSRNPSGLPYPTC